MIKIELEPKRLMDMLSKSLINAKGIESVSAIISPTGMAFSDISKRVLGVYAQFNQSYFTNYEVDEDREVMFTKEFLDGLSNLRFGEEDRVSIQVDDANNCFLVRAGGKSWDPKLSQVADERIKFKLNEVPGIGTLPTQPKTPMLSQFSIGVDKLNAPDVEKITLRIVEGEALSMELDYGGPFTEQLTAVQTRTMTAGAWTLFVEMLRNILNNFKGEVWVAVYEKIVFFTRIEEDYSLMYFMSVT